MSNNKFVIPSSLRTAAGGSSNEAEKTRRAEIEGSYKQATEETRVLREVVSAARDVLGLIRSFVELGTTWVEWEGRVRQAEAAVRKAEVELAAMRDKNAVAHRRLDQIDAVLKSLLDGYQNVLNDLEGAPLDLSEKQMLWRELLDFGDRLVAALNSYKD